MPRTGGRAAQGQTSARLARSSRLRLATPPATLVSHDGTTIEIAEIEDDGSSPAHIDLALRTLARLMVRAHAAERVPNTKLLDFRATSRPDPGDEAA